MWGTVPYLIFQSCQGFFSDYREVQKPRKNLVSLNSRILEMYLSDKKCGLLLDLDTLDYLIVSQQR